MRDVITPIGFARIVRAIHGVPENQARALDRRHRLDIQQRSFLTPYREFASEMALAPGPFAVMAGAGRGRA